MCNWQQQEKRFVFVYFASIKIQTQKRSYVYLKWPSFYTRTLLPLRDTPRTRWNDNHLRSYFTAVSREFFSKILFIPVCDAFKDNPELLTCFLDIFPQWSCCLRLMQKGKSKQQKALNWIWIRRESDLVYESFAKPQRSFNCGERKGLK